MVHAWGAREARVEVTGQVGLGRIGTGLTRAHRVEKTHLQVSQVSIGYIGTLKQHLWYRNLLEVFGSDCPSKEVSSHEFHDFRSHL
jgi:hypothetical protein